MKKLLMLMVLFVMGVSQMMNAQAVSESKLYGKWLLTNKDGSTMTLDFATDGEYGMVTMMQPTKYVERGIGAHYKMYVYMPVYWSLNGSQLEVVFDTHSYDSDIKVVKYVGVTKSQAENEYAYDFEQLERALLNDFETQVTYDPNPVYVFKVLSVSPTTMVVKARGASAKTTFKRVK